MRRGGEPGTDEPLAVRREGLGAGEDEEGCATGLVDGSAMERCCFGEVVLAVELRRHRRRLRALVVDVMLTASESRMREGERK